MLLFQVALQAGRASIVVPVSGITGSVYFIITGTWLFHEHLPASPARLAVTPMTFNRLRLYRGPRSPRIDRHGGRRCGAKPRN